MAAWRHVARMVGLGAMALAVAAQGSPAEPAPEITPWAPYTVESSTQYGEYEVCVWASLDSAAPGYYRVVTIARAGIVLVCHDWATGLGALSGCDVDGSGWPNVIVETYSGGAHCCFATYVYDLAADLVPIELPASPGGDSEAEFVDLNGDGIYEVVTADDSFAYAYCAYAGSPAVRVILGYDELRRRYIPVSPAYRLEYIEEIARDTLRAQSAATSETYPGWDGTPKCEVLPLVLDYLYSGDADAAWAALARYYDAPDRDAFRAEIESVVDASPYYTALGD